MSSVVFLDPQNATKSLAAGASPKTPLRPTGRADSAGFKGSTLRPVLLRGVEGR